MTTSTVTLTEFLLARIAEDETVARGVDDLDDGPGEIDLHVGLAPAATHQTGWLEVDPLRVLAECEAKRRIVSEHTRDRYSSDPCDAHDGATLETVDCDTLRFLALPYADHPEYRDEWRP